MPSTLFGVGGWVLSLGLKLTDWARLGGLVLRSYTEATTAFCQAGSGARTLVFMLEGQALYQLSCLPSPTGKCSASTSKASLILLSGSVKPHYTCTPRHFLTVVPQWTFKLLQIL